MMEFAHEFLNTEIRVFHLFAGICFSYLTGFIKAAIKDFKK